MRTGAVEHKSAALIAVHEGSMRHLLAVVAAAMAMAAIGPVAAQVPPLATPQPWQPATTYPAPTRLILSLHQPRAMLTGRG